jgi:hypothetical protein
VEAAAPTSNPFHSSNAFAGETGQSTGGTTLGGMLRLVIESLVMRQSVAMNDIVDEFRLMLALLAAPRFLDQ